jgi:predicted transcriptional regulator
MNIENFIKQNRRELDTETAPAFVWEKIEKQLIAPKEEKSAAKIINFSFLRYAAAALILFSVGVYYGSSPTKNMINDMKLANISPELDEIEGFYNQKVNYTLSELSEVEIDTMIQNEMHNLDRYHEQFKQELLRSPESNKQRIIQLMIKNHQMKLEILNTYLNSINKINKKNYHEKTDI